MKPKPLSHKNLNTFHFSTFSERLNDVNVSVLRHDDITARTPEGRNTYFWEAFEKWRERDYSIDYDNFRKELGDEIETLQQILFRKDEIMQILLKYLSKQESLAVPAIMEITVALVRDLQDEVYPYFPQIFSAITSHFHTQDTDLLERLFMGLAYLFKFFWKYMIKDIKNVYKLFSSLLEDSNREHIKVFACESFGFLIRKVRSREELFTYILKGLEKRPELTPGVGQLFFEVVKGVKEQFHSSVEPVLKALLKLMGNESLSPNLIEEALLQTFTSMAMHTVQKHCEVVQKILCEVVRELITECQKSPKEFKFKHLDHVLHLLLFWLKFKNGKLITSENNLIEVICHLTSLKGFPDYCMKSVVEIASAVLISSCLKLSIDKVNLMVAEIYSCSEEIIFLFTQNMFKYGMFEKDILPVLVTVSLKMLQTEDASKKKGVLRILSDTVTTLRPVIANEDDIKSFTKLYLYPSSAKVSNSGNNASYSVLEEFLIETLSSSEVKQSELPDIWSALVCIPHLRSLNMEKASTALERLSQQLSEILLTSEGLTHQEVEEFGFVLCQAYFTFLIITNNKSKGIFETSFFIDLLKKLPSCISILRMVYCHLSSFSTLPEIDELHGLISLLISNLSSPFHLIRLFTLKVLKTFDTQMKVSKNDGSSVFSICLEAEKVPVDVQNYREKLKFLRKLEYKFIHKDLPATYEDLLLKACIHYFLGMLHINFKLMWEPTLGLLETFAHGTKLFWGIFGPYLTNTVELCVKYSSTGKCFVISKWEAENDKNSAYIRSIKSCCEPEEDPDIMNHRLLLWKSMELFPDVAEARNRVVVPLMFQLMTNEVAKVDTSLASTEAVNKDSSEISDSNYVLENLSEERTPKGIKRKLGSVQVMSKKLKITESMEETDTKELDDAEESVKEGEVAGDESEADEDENEAEGDENEADEFNEEDFEKEEDNDLNASKFTLPRKKISNKRRFHLTKTLAAYLSVFAKFNSPKSGYKHVELEQLYNELLTYPDPTIQKLAFDCLLTFKLKYLKPYKDNFYRILDNKTFKTEVVLFNLDKENKVIQEEHRLDALAVLMRILYGKMLHKTGSNTSGKSLANARRSLVLRFLAGCQAEELKIFFDLVFLPFKELLKDDTLSAVKKLRVDLDLSNIVPIRRQHSALNTLGLILKHLGNLVTELLPYLFKVLLVITATSTSLLEKRNEVLPQCLNMLKSVRTLAVMRLIQFFKTFNDYPFSPEEIDAVFESIVWPMLPRLEIESVNQPSPLLRLFATWSENSRYFILFAKHHEKSEANTPLRHIMDLYCSPKAKARVMGVVAKMLYQFLTTENKVVRAEEEEDETKKKIPPIEISFCIPLPEVTIDGVDSSLGNKLLQPYVEHILSRIASLLAVKKIKKNLSTRDLTIMLRISRFIQKPEQCSKLIELLPPFLANPKVNHESEVIILKTISNLIKNCLDPNHFIRQFAPLFGKLTNQNSRTALVGVFASIADVRPEVKKLADIVSKVNAFDPGLVEEPDYQLRIDGHKEALEIIKAMDIESLNIEFIRIIIFNSTFMIRTVNDMALRSNSSYLLQELTKVMHDKISSNSNLTQILLYNTLLAEIQKGLKSASEAVRHEFIQILSVVLSSWKEQPSFKNLVVLCNEDQELDFWENIRHLQVHRRARALLRFSELLKSQHESEEQISVHYLMSYILPIVTSFLFDAAYKKHVHVIDAAIETLGVIAQTLPWHHYEPLLKHYLQMMTSDSEHHKTVIKVIVSILNAFHFKACAKQENANPIRNETKEVGDEEKNKMEIDDESENKISNISIVEDDAQSKNTAMAESNRIYIAIKKNILPLLHRSLMKKTKSDDEHKLSGHYYPEDEDVLRVPIALAMVKLLQNLPIEILEKSLPGLFLRMCDLLKTKTESIRQTARETLVKMLDSLGPKYFPCLVNEMKGVMKKGYQVHVMTYSVNAVLVKLSSQMKPGDLDPCAQNLIEICTNELFTDVAEEKEVEKITAKVKEAKSVKSYSIFQQLSRFITGSYLLEMIKPLKEALGGKHSHKTMKKVSESLRHIALGLSENKDLSCEKKLMFVHGIINESMPGINKKRQTEPVKSKKIERPDSYLIPKEPGRSGPPAKINIRTTDHVFVEFGLQILHLSLKRDQFDKNRKEILEMLDPFVSLLTDCLQSNNIKIITEALRCLLPLYKFSLPSFKTATKKVVGFLFLLVNKYAAVGMGQGENFEMILMCFKLFTVLVRDTSYHTWTEEQLQSLLSYIAQDIYDYTRQGTAFTLLKAILTKKLQAPELKTIMSKIAEMAISSEQDHIRVQCRQVCMHYMLDYPLGKKLAGSISFFAVQLEYQHEHGRVSALEIINSMLQDFPKNVIKKYSSMLLVPLAARLVNDESSNCRKMCAMCIKKLLTIVEHDGRQGLFSIPLNWLKVSQNSHKRVGLQLLGLFAEVAGEELEQHLQEILSHIIELVIAVKKVEIKSSTDERCADHFLYHILNALFKILTFCPVVRKEEFSEILDSLWSELQGLVLYPHLWVRLATGELFGILLSTYSVGEVVSAIAGEETKGSVYLNTKQKLRDLSADFATQLQSPYLNEKLGEQIIRNLVYLARVINQLPEPDGSEADSTEVTVEWIVRKLCREAKMEVAEQPEVIQRRKCVFMFMGAFVNEMGKDRVLPLLNTILLPLSREISDNSKYPNEELRKCAQEVLDLIQNIVGVEDFTAIYSSVQMSLLKKKAKRKQEKAAEAVTNPQKYAEKRIKKQLSKKEAKKRKIIKMKGNKKVPKKRKLTDLVIAS